MRVITGCSRSGTSFICQVLARLGAEFGSGEELVEADEWNQRGYFENRAVNTLNHRLLFGESSDPRLWVDVMWPKDWRVRVRKLTTIAAGPFLTSEKQIARRAEMLREEIAKLSETNRGRCVKDPRFCYLMAPWMRFGGVRSALFVVRHPWESASSMSRQTGLPLPLTYQGWVDSVKRFWDGLPDLSVHIVDYNEFFDPARRAEAARPLFAFLGIDFDEERAGAIVAETLSDELRTRKVSEVKMPKTVSALYDELRSR